MFTFLILLVISVILPFSALAKQGAATAQSSAAKQEATKSAGLKESQGTSKTSQGKIIPEKQTPEAKAKTEAANGAFAESFEDGWDSRWHFTNNVSVVSDPEAKGHVLSFNDPGFAELGLDVQDLTLDFRVKPAKEEQEAPVVQVALRVHGEPPQQSAYQVIFFQKRIEVQREINQQRRTLAQAHKGLTPDTWQKVSIKLVGGQIDVSLEGQPVLSVKDTKNLTSGIVAFFCHGGGQGFAIDDVTITSFETKESQ